MALLNISNIRWRILVIIYGIICLVASFFTQNTQNDANMPIHNNRHLL